MNHLTIDNNRSRVAGLVYLHVKNSLGRIDDWPNCQRVWTDSGDDKTLYILSDNRPASRQIMCRRTDWGTYNQAVATI